MNSNDRELLELAAKAAGHHVRYVSDGKGGGSFFMEPSQLWWNPLTDDGDALRLAVKCKLMIDTADFGMATAYWRGGHLQDKCYRRAIVRAAAKVVQTN